MLLLVLMMLCGLAGSAWVLSRTRLSWWVRVPGCIVAYPIAAFIGIVTILGVGIGTGYAILGAQWIVANWPF
jgi:hypothetical protein